MGNEIFKKKQSLNMTEELSKSIKTIHPGVWILVCSILAFLIGFFVFIYTNTYTSTISVCCYVEDGIAEYYVKESDYYLVKVGQEVYYEDSEQVDRISGVRSDVATYDSELYGDYIASLGNYKDGDKLYTWFSKSSLDEGTHQGYIVVGRFDLISLFTN